MQRFESVQTLLLIGAKQRANLCIQLFDNGIRRLPSLLMNGIELRLHLRHQRLDLSLLRIAQVEKPRQHQGQIGWTMMMKRHWIFRSLCICDRRKSKQADTGESKK